MILIFDPRCNPYFSNFQRKIGSRNRSMQKTLFDLEKENDF